MANKTITNVDMGSVLIGSGYFYDEVIAVTEDRELPAGLILARSTAGATDGKLVPYVSGGADGSGTPRFVLTYDVDATDGDNPARVLISGPVDQNRLIVDGEDPGDEITASVRDTLRRHMIIVQDSDQLSSYDNQ